MPVALSSPLPLASPPRPCNRLPPVCCRPSNPPATGTLLCEELSAASLIAGTLPQGVPDHCIGDVTTVNCKGGCSARPLGVTGHEKPPCTDGGRGPAPANGLPFGGPVALDLAATGPALDIGCAGVGVAVQGAAVDAGFAGGDADAGRAAPMCGFGVALGAFGVRLGSLGCKLGYNAGPLSRSYLRKVWDPRGLTAQRPEDGSPPVRARRAMRPSQPVRTLASRINKYGTNSLTRTRPGRFLVDAFEKKPHDVN